MPTCNHKSSYALPAIPTTTGVGHILRSNYEIALKNILKNKKFGPDRFNLKRVGVDNAIDRLDWPEKKAFFDFIERDIGSKHIGLLTSGPVVRALPKIRGFGTNNGLRFLNIVVNSSACKTIVDPNFLSYIGSQNSKVLTGLLVSMFENPTANLAILTSPKVKEAIENSMLEKWDGFAVSALFRAIVKSQDERLAADIFVANLSKLNDKSRMAVLEAAIRGANIGVIVSNGTTDIAKRMENLPMPLLSKILMKVTSPKPVGIRPTV
jgi:hypothetical protein